MKYNFSHGCNQSSVKGDTNTPIGLVAETLRIDFVMSKKVLIMLTIV